MKVCCPKCKRTAEAFPMTVATWCSNNHPKVEMKEAACGSKEEETEAA